MTDAGDSARVIRFASGGSALVYPTPGSARGDRVAGRGKWTLLLDPLEDGRSARMRLGDFSFCFLPGSHIHFDVDGDGLLERLDLGDFRLTREHFDLDQTEGTLILETGEVTLRLVFTINPDEIPGLGRLAEHGPINFDLTERGRFDLESGRYETSSDLFTIPEGPFAGLTILNCIDKILSYHSTSNPPPAVALGVVVLPDGGPLPSADIPAGQAPKAVWICPGTPIKLLWDSTNADTVEITPDLGNVPLKGEQVIPDTSSTNPKLHAEIVQSRGFHAIAERLQNCRGRAEDDVTVNVIGPRGEEFAQSANYVDGAHYWTAYLPEHTYDSRIRVSAVVIDSGRADSITHPSWRVDHVYDAQPPVGTVIPSLNTTKATGAKHALPGEYRFTPMPAGVVLPPNEGDRTLYFRLTTEPCH